jgi:regulator of protease activity HflC (stomatin/prohibitin superfamily)
MIEQALQTAGVLQSNGPGVVELVLGIGLLIAVVTAYQSIVIVRAYEKRAYTRFGKFQGLLEPGPNVVLPFVTKTYKFDMRTQTLDVPRQEAITRDNSPVTADAVVYIKVMDAQKAFLQVDNYKEAVSNLAQTTLRAVLGDMELDDTLNKRQEIRSARSSTNPPTSGGFVSRASRCARSTPRRMSSRRWSNRPPRSAAVVP